jgi:peptidoglycan hydrolase CwlO-like protein
MIDIANISKKAKLLFLVVVFISVNLYNLGFQARANDTSDINKVEKKLEAAQQDLTESQGALKTTQGQINTTASLISQAKSEISRKETEIKNMEERINLNHDILASYIQEMYYSDQNAISTLLLEAENFDNYFGNFDQILNAKEKVLNLIEETKKYQSDLENAKGELANKKVQHEKLLVAKQAEKSAIVSDINETQLTIVQLQAKLNKLRSALSGFLGKSYSMEDVIDAVKNAEKETGVRKEFLFAVLDKETDLGRFTGGCNYKKSKMGSANEKIFKSICDEFRYDYDKAKVSCPLSYGIGGAMGVAQFMPTTWAGWSSKIAAVTGNSPADPWKLEDGIVGMALKLKAGGAGSKSGEYQAAAMYYCGGNWKRTVCKNYANTVISWSKGYDDYFK